MRMMYSGFYSTAEQTVAEIWSSDSTLFIFDTNCLLNLYRCEDHTREEILNVMRAIERRIWIPFQVGYEYQRNRHTVIQESITSLTKIQDGLQRIYSENLLSPGGVKKHLYSALSDETSDLQLKLKETIEEFINNKITPRITSKKEISNHDSIRDEIDAIINNNVGELPTQERIDSINTEGNIRYDNKIPPGFKDAAKKTTSYYSGLTLQDKFGDLYIWKEIIERSKQEEVKNVIFVCDDTKEDWWFEHAGRTHGPLESLKTEICKEANIENFRLVSQSTFLHDATKYLRNVDVSAASLKEVEGLSQNTREDDIRIHYSPTTNFFKFGRSKYKYLDNDQLSLLNDEEIKNHYHYSLDFHSPKTPSQSLFNVYESASNEAERILAELKDNCNRLFEIVSPESYESTVKRLTMSLHKASYSAERLQSYLDLMDGDEDEDKYIQKEYKPFIIAIIELNMNIEKAKKLLSRLS
ncbi:TPA: PIN domain-containing protein [Enterobacter hormaechei subsp. hormaechei]